MRPDFSAPLRLAGLYALFSTAWIFSSDYLLSTIISDSALITRLQTLKGTTFVLLSSLLIFTLSHRDLQAQRRLLDALRYNTRMLQKTQYTAALGSWAYADQFHWSGEALRLLGRDEGSAHSSLQQLLGWLHPAERAAVQRGWLALTEQGLPLSVSARLHRPSGEPTWLMLRGEVDDSGQILGTLQDISHQKRDESALRESELRFRQLFEQTPHIAVHGYDREHRVIYWNQASVQLYGYSVEEAIGRRLEQLIVPPATRGPLEAAINRWMQGGAAMPSSERQLQRKDGSPVWVYSSHSLLRNGRGQLELYWIDIDLSEQKQANDELHGSEVRYRELVEQLSDVIFMTDAEGRLSFVSPAWEGLSGYNGYECLGRPLVQYLHEEDRARLTRQLANFAGGPPSSLRGDYRLLARNGQVRWVELQLSPRPADRSLRGSLRDIHERYQNQLLQQARNAVLDELLGRQPLPQILTGISLRLQSLNPRMLVSIMLLDRQMRLHMAAAPSLPADYCRAIDGLSAGLEIGSCGHAACSGELVIAEDLDSHPYWRQFSALTRAAGLQACWSLPFKDDEGRVLGTFGIYARQPARPNTADIALVTEFTRLASLAVQQQGDGRQDYRPSWSLPAP